MGKKKGGDLSKFETSKPDSFKESKFKMDQFEDSKSVIQELSKHSDKTRGAETIVPKLDLQPGKVVYRNKKDLQIGSKPSAQPSSPKGKRKLTIVNDEKRGSFLEMSFKNDPQIDPLGSIKEDKKSPEKKNQKDSKEESVVKDAGKHKPVDTKFMEACDIRKGGVQIEDDFANEMNIGGLFDVKVQDKDTLKV